MSENNGYKDNALSRVYREGSWPEPSRQIDEAILAASRRAARERHPFVWRWAPPFAIAATVVLSSAIVLRAMQEKPSVVSEVVSEPAPVTKAKPAQASAEKQKAAEERDRADKPAAPPPQPVSAPPPGFTLQMDAAEAERLERLQRDLGLKQGPPASESPLREAKTQSAVRRAAEAPPAVIPKAAFAEKPPTPVKKETPSAPLADQAQPAPTPPGPQQNAPQTQFFRQAPAGVVRPEPLAAVKAPEPVARAPEQAAPLARASAFVPGRSPQAWLDDIRRLKAEGKTEEAARQLAEFKGLYPDITLPEDLR
jgi:hypothetical protein